MHGDLGKVDVIESDEGTSALDGREAEEVVEDVSWEINGDACRIVLGDWRNQDAVTEEELVIDGECIAVLWVLEPERVENGGTIDMSLMERSVEIIEKTIATTRQ